MQRDNYDAHLFGVDVSGSKLLLETGKYGNLTGKTVLNYVRGQNNDTGGNLYQQMPFNATVALEHKRGGWSFHPDRLRSLPLSLYCGREFIRAHNLDKALSQIAALGRPGKLA